MEAHQLNTKATNKADNGHIVDSAKGKSVGSEISGDESAAITAFHHFGNIHLYPGINEGEEDSGKANAKTGLILQPELIQKKLSKAGNSPSQGLADNIRAGLQNFLSADLSQVKVHDNPASHEASANINAVAYTSGNHIFLGKETGAMHRTQQNALLAHEVVHTIQQKSFSPSVIQTKPLVGASDSNYENEANNIADAFVQVQNTDYKSAGLRMRSNMRVSAVTSPVIQRVEKTWGGEWDTTKYQKTVPAKAAGLRGANIELVFKPGAMVDAELIGLIQTAKAVNRGKVSYIGDKTRKAHGIQSADAKEIDSVSKETDEGTHIDQVGYNRNPLYAVEGAPATDANLQDTLPVAGDATKSSGYGRHGFRFKDPAGNLKEQHALLNDSPVQSNVAKNSSNIFEVTALAIKGKQAGTYYGSVQWGWRTDAAGTHDLIPLKSISQGAPTASFIKSAEIWNAGKTSKNKDTLDLPIPVNIFSGPMDEIFDTAPLARVERVARVRIVDDSDITQSLIEVLSGPSTGARGYVNTIGGNPFRNIER